MTSLATTAPFLDSALAELKKRQNSDGGFSILSDGPSRPDATAWALLSLRSNGLSGEPVEKAAAYLKTFQLADGRVVVAHDEPQVVWVTYIAAWAWKDISSCVESRRKALDFILGTSGNWTYFRVWGMAHDPSLRGWSWVEHTSAWVDSTALALLALRSAGLTGHKRYAEGIRMLEDRELPSGGWNCGNTIVYGTELRPTSESSGIAMALLDRHNSRHASSVKQLRQFIRPESGPLTLSWALLSVGEEKDLETLEKTLALQQEKGFCQSEWLSLLCMSGSLLMMKPESSLLGFSDKEPA